MSNRRECLTGVYLAIVWLIGVRLKPPSHTGRHWLGGMLSCVMAPPNGSDSFYTLVVRVLQQPLSLLNLTEDALLTPWIGACGQRAISSLNAITGDIGNSIFHIGTSVDWFPLLSRNHTGLNREV